MPKIAVIDCGERTTVTAADANVFQASGRGEDQ